MEMIEKRVSELEGPALDWAVAVADPRHIVGGNEFYSHIVKSSDDEEGWFMPVGKGGWSPSTDWSQGGPLIDRFDIGFIRVGDTIFATTDASDWDYSGFLGGETGGSTRLIAAMRAIVAAVLGEVVKVPASLVGGGDA